MQPTIHFRISERAGYWLLLLAIGYIIKISSFFRKWLNTSKRLFNMYSYLMREQKLPLYHFRCL
jgi:hypothetical protein